MHLAAFVVALIVLASEPGHGEYMAFALVMWGAAVVAVVGWRRPYWQTALDVALLGLLASAASVHLDFVQAGQANNLVVLPQILALGIAGKRKLIVRSKNGENDQTAPPQ
jgi:hypothetical protein